MFLVGHASVGIAITAALGVTNPVAAFGIGWLSHYLADFFPHGDEPVGEWAEKGDKIFRLFTVLLADSIVFLAAFGWYTANHGWQLASALAALGSFMPDILWGSSLVFKKQFIPVLEKFHHLNHNYFHPKIPAWVPMVGQLSVAA